MMKKTAIVNLLFLSFLFILTAPDRVSGEEIPLMELEQVYNHIMSPGCDYLYTLVNCPSEDAAQMRELVKDKLTMGETREDILNYFEGIYGPRVLAQPKKKGFYFVAWWFPYFLILDVFILTGVILLIWRRRAGKKADMPVTASTEDNRKLDEDIDSYLEDEVRKFREE
ncbi:MAG: cytochrome c-type biogenesis protein CcmH [Nitrospiraceae bacterium]|nr:MAG: cytochrome c-type biogenesis protein CcmH [Nitrospiraceae bacterium]